MKVYSPSTDRASEICITVSTTKLVSLHSLIKKKQNIHRVMFEIALLILLKRNVRNCLIELPFIVYRPYTQHCSSWLYPTTQNYTVA